MKNQRNDDIEMKYLVRGLAPKNAVELKKEAQLQKLINVEGRGPAHNNDDGEMKKEA